jgi:hypothetical protein
VRVFVCVEWHTECVFVVDRLLYTCVRRSNKWRLLSLAWCNLGWCFVAYKRYCFPINLGWFQPAGNGNLSLCRSKYVGPSLISPTDVVVWYHPGWTPACCQRVLVMRKVARQERFSNNITAVAGAKNRRDQNVLFVFC